MIFKQSFQTTKANKLFVQWISVISETMTIKKTTINAYYYRVTQLVLHHHKFINISKLRSV